MKKASVSRQGAFYWLVPSLVAVALPWASYGGVRTVSAAIDNQTDGFTITLGEASGTANTVFAAYGATDAGTTPSAWEHVARVGVVAAEDSTISFAAPKEWESSAHAIRFFAVDGDLSGDIPVQYVSGEDENVSFPLNYVPKADTRTQIKFMYTHHNGSTFFGTPFGTADASDYRFFQGGDNAIAYFDMGLSGQRILQADVLTDPAVIRHFELGNHYIKDLDTDTIIVSAESAEDLTGYASALQLFAGGDYGRVYSLKIYEGETLKLDLVPYLKSNGTPAFRDSLTGNFYVASGTGVVGFGDVVIPSEAICEVSAVIEEAYTTTPLYTDYSKMLVAVPSGTAVLSPGAEFSDVPVLLRLSSSIAADFTRKGKDMLIMDEESNVLPYEIEAWNPSGESLVWVKAIKYSSDTRLVAYYGDSQGRRNGANDPKQVWSSYAGVWHLDELGTEITLADSSPNGYDGKTYNVSKGLSGGALGNFTRCIDKQTEGSEQGGLYFDGTKNIDHGGKLTLSAYVKRYQLNSCWDHLFFSKPSSNDGNGSFAVELYGQDSKWGQADIIGGYKNDKTGVGVLSAHGFKEADKWYHIVVTYDNYEAYYYCDGVRLGGGRMTNAIRTNKLQRFALGNNNTLNGTPWDGAFDEFRVSVGAMSPERIALEYALMQNGAMTITAGVNTGVRLQFGDVSFVSNNDGTFSASAALTAGSAASVSVVLSDGTSTALSSGAVVAPWSVSGATVSPAANTSFKAKFRAESDNGDDVYVSVDDYFYSGAVMVSATKNAYEEDLAAGEFVFSRAEGDAATAFPLVVNYIVSGSATSGTDYEPLLGTVTIPAGESSVAVQVSPLKSGMTDDDVSVTVTVSAGNYDAGSSSASVVIVNSRDPAFTKYSKRLPITVTAGKYTGSALADFPVLVRLAPSEGGFSYADFKRDDYEDLAFVDDDLNILPYEVQKWDETGTSLVWVKVPSFSSTTTIYALYGATTSGRTTTADVWSSFIGVWHMDETFEGENTVKDATVNGLDGTTTANSSAVANGVFGGARMLATTGGKSEVGRIRVPYNAVMCPDSGYQNVTASLWCKFNLPSQSWAYLIARKKSDGAGSWGLQLCDSNPPKKLRIYTGGNNNQFDNMPTLAESVWHRVTLVYNGNNRDLYIDGAHVIDNFSAGSWISKDTETGLSIGGGWNNDTWSTVNGAMDEVRVAMKVLSADWEAADYAQQTDAAFLSLGAPVDVVATAPSVGAASLATVDGKQMIAVPLEGGEGQLYVVVRDSLGNVTTNAVTDGIVSAGTYYYPVSSLPVNLVCEIGTYAVGVENKTDSRKYSVSARNGKTEKIDFRVRGYSGNPVENFPALVRLTEGIGGFSYLRLSDEGATAGGIHFQDASGNELPFDVDYWNPEGESTIWVRLPSLHRDAKIVMLYGVDYTPADANALRASVWSGQTAVWHLHMNTVYDGDGTGRYGNSAKESMNDLRGWNNGTITVADGIVGESRRISTGAKGDKGGGYAIVVSNSDLLDIGNNFTVSLWLRYPKDQVPGWDRVISRKESYNSGDGWEITLAQDTPANLDVRGSNQKSGGQNFFSSPVNDGNWHYVTAVYSGTSVLLYENGVERLAVEIDEAVNNDKDLAFGNIAKKDEVTFKGWLDEIRLGAGSLSADRIKADYETVANPDFFSASEVVTGFTVIIK